MHRFAIITCIFLVSLLISLYKLSTYSIRDFIIPVNPKLKHILLWTPEKTERFARIGLGQKGFINRNCSYINCYVTAANRYFGGYRKFHAVVFEMPHAVRYPQSKFPRYRSPEQKFVFCSIESSQYYPACSNRFDGYFNWTWSFRLDSDCRFEYIAIRDENKTIIGPNMIMHWMDLKNMRPVSDEFKKSLRSKTKAVAWFVSNCESRSRREKYVNILEKELAGFNHVVDIYGRCGKLWCPPEMEKCYEIIKQDYYFYLAFENSFSVDYVTEKLLTPLQNNAIPIVYGQANYTRFMPDGIYLDATALTPKRIAEEIDYLIKNPDKYAEYFKWKNHYSYHARSESPETDGFCALCKMLNDEEKFKKKSVVKNFREWWDSPDFCNK